MESQWLPNDIILQILSKLPVKSLLQFRSVCKDWCCSISNPEFTLSTQRRGRVIVESIWKGTQILEEETVLESVDGDGVSIERLVKPWEEKQQQQHHHQDLHLLGSCNGLLLVSLHTDILLWNPSTRVCQKVLTYDMNPNFIIYWNDDALISGFCYDSTMDDYKVLIQCPPNGYCGDGYLIHFCSLKNKCWKEIVLHYRVLLSHYWKPIVNGHCHWVVYNESSYFIIIYFDQIQNEFRELPIPDQNGYRVLGLGELDGCLAISRTEYSTCSYSYNERFVGIVEVWTMKEYGVQESWSYLFKISNLGEMNDFYGLFDELEPLCYTKDGQLIMRVGREQIVVYDPKQELYRRITVTRDNFWITEVAMYVESLISPLDLVKTY